MLECADIHVAFGGNQVLEGFSHSFNTGVTALVGSNGSGKSTLLNVLSGFLRPNRGYVLWNGTEITTMNPVARVRVGITRTFQDGRMVTELLAWEHVALGLRWGQARSLLTSLALSRVHRIVKRRKEAATDILQSLEVNKLANKPISTLSIGQRRLVALATAVAADSPCYLFDEPTAGLDMTHGNLAARCIRTLADSGKVIVLVEHNHLFVDLVADSVVGFDH
ncbi:ATP-binding cassette domain-containing protein [Candidatus Thiosymbion oneisti]|uniref:ATP-binding cassette domain-containing protein n=1 Tax=Candidatus Thiosymbion oneisti TaxID=589554 RepID=UPI000B7FF1F6|nr:ATP-binding cassette domain-containing protein [Candidatus Thiosymbion oneisti]